MATELEQLARGAAPAIPGRRAAVKGRRKAAVLLVALGPERAARDLQAPARRRDRGAVARDGQAPAASTPETSAARHRASSPSRRVAGARLAEGGVDYAREVLERALGPRARRRRSSARLSAVIERTPVRVPAPHAARADRRVPAQRVAADDRARRRQPAHHARRPGARASCPSPSQADVALRIARMGETTRTSSSRSRT